MICTGSAGISSVLGADPAVGANPATVGSSEDGHQEEKYSCVTMA